MTANDRKSYLSIWMIWVDQYNITYHRTVNTQLINTDYSALTEKTRAILKHLSLKLMIVSELLSIRIFLVNVILKNDQDIYKK